MLPETASKVTYTYRIIQLNLSCSTKYRFRGVEDASQGEYPGVPPVVTLCMHASGYSANTGLR